MPVCPFFAGWLVARGAAGAGAEGVCVAAVTSGMLSFADQCSWQFRNPGDSSPALQVALIALMMLGQLLLMGVAVAGARIGSQDAAAKS
jgi:hypothetical protein